MSLIGAGFRQSPIVEKGIDFIINSVRPDGSWPIDSDLAVWITSLTVNALATESGPSLWPDRKRKQKTLDWLLARQYRTRHPYTETRPGGWAWTDRPGGVPDADDTAGALLAIHHLSNQLGGSNHNKCLAAASSGLHWLLQLQNRDGGIPTFCRGWMNLPFDRSAPDLTAHAIKAIEVWTGEVDPRLHRRLTAATARALRFLSETQQDDGAWTALWFGHQEHPQKANPVYGTARVITGIHRLAAASRMVDRAGAWLLRNQNRDGGWGGMKGLESSIEETALAVAAIADLVSSGKQPESARIKNMKAACHGGRWLIDHTRQGRSVTPSPIGLYFAQLWYFEELYPSIFAVDALQKLRNALASQNQSSLRRQVNSD